MLPLAQAQKSRRSPSATAKIPTVAFCELVQHPSRYNHKVVRVKGNLFGGMEVSALEDFNCDDDRSIWVEFDDSYKSCTPNDVYSSFRNIFHPPGNSEMISSHRVEIIAIGEFEVAGKFKKTPYAFGNNGFGHMNQYAYQLPIKCLEKAKPE